MFWLKVGSEKLPVRLGETTMGRSAYCTLVVNSSTASREHAVLTYDGDELLLRDVGSRNGTSLNGERVTEPVRVRAGDVIKIGSREIQVLEGPRITAPDTITLEREISEADVKSLQLNTHPDFSRNSDSED